MKKNKSVKWIILIVGAALVVGGAIWGKQYYDSRYVGTDYYTMVPLDYNMTPEALYDMSGKEQVGTGVKYKLTAYNEQGEAKTVEFTVMEDSGNMPQPGTYLQVSASKQIVLSWSVIEESNIPGKTLNMIKTNS